MYFIVEYVIVFAERTKRSHSHNDRNTLHPRLYRWNSHWYQAMHKFEPSELSHVNHQSCTEMNDPIILKEWITKDELRWMTQWAAEPRYSKKCCRTQWEVSFARDWTLSMLLNRLDGDVCGYINSVNVFMPVNAREQANVYVPPSLACRKTARYHAELK